jgi:hypothetical protein
LARTRLIRPTFFSDSLMAELSVSSRLTYIGLWTLADDAGYLEADVREIAVELFPFESPKRRETRIATAIDELANLVDKAGKPEPRIVWLPCGDHLLIPTLPEHRQKGGETLFTIRKRHETRCLRSTSEGLRSPDLRRTTSGYVPDSLSDSDSSSFSDSLDAQARDEKKTTGGLRRAAAAAGGYVGRIAAQKDGES